MKTSPCNKGVLAFFFILLTASCISQLSEHEIELVTDESQYIITNEIVRDIALQLSKSIAVTTRTELQPDAKLIEDEYKKILTPFVCDGKLMKEELYEQLNSNTPRYFLTEEEKEWLQYMRDEDFAAMSFILYAIQAEEAKYNQVGKCLIGATLGITSISTITNLRGLYKAKTALQVFKAIGKRYFFGYLGLAYTIYDFAVCMELIHPYETINEQPIIP